jgi:hypothetical protein
LLADSAGHYIHPATPSGTCGAPLPDVYKTVESIVWRTVSITPLSRTRPDRPVISGCATHPRSSVQQASVSDSDTAVRLNPEPRGLRACIYQSLDEAGDGMLARVLSVRGRRAAQLVQALHGTPSQSHQSCPTQNQFAVIHDHRGASVTVELGGCWRVARDIPSSTILGTAVAEQITRLLQLPELQ